MSSIVSAILFLFTISGVLIASSMLRDFKTAQGAQLSIVILSSSTASLAYGMEILATGLSEKYFWVVVRYFALNFFVFAAALFVFYFTRTPIQLKSLRFLALCLVPGIALFFMATYPMTHLVYDQLWLNTNGPIPMLGKTVGPLYWVINIYDSIILLWLIYLVLKNISRGSLLNRRQSLIVTGALVLIAGTHLLYLGGARLLSVLNPNLFCYFPAAVLILWGATRFRLADIRPIARNLLFEQMQDGILVLNLAGVLIDINPAAEKYLNIFQRTSIGKPLLDSAVELAGILSNMESDEKADSVIFIRDCPMQVSINPLLMRGGVEGGTLIILRDVTDRMDVEMLKEVEIKRQASWMERQKIARTLHDSISQYLNSLVLLAGSANQRLELAKYEQLGAIIQHISSAARKASEELRVLIGELQIESPADTGFDLLKAITERLSFIGTQSDLHTDFTAPTSLDLDSSQAREIFYIVLEALNNVLRHSGADQVSVRLSQDHGLFTAEISDNGHGFEAGQIGSGMGLANMRERARQLAGELSIESSPGIGTRISLHLSVKRPPEGM